MAKGTKKAGITGRYGPRYGVKIRKQIKSVSRHRARPQRCPECQADAVKRLSSGIWVCRHCNLKFAASAYSIRTRSYKREEAKSQLEKFMAEDSRDLRDELEDSGITSQEDAPEPEPATIEAGETPEMIAPADSAEEVEE